jgi:hypothetical protein
MPSRPMIPTRPLLSDEQHRRIRRLLREASVALRDRVLSRATRLVEKAAAIASEASRDDQSK